jgi:hypothetical protein
MDLQWVMQLQRFIIVLSKVFLGKYAYDKIVTMAQNERQWSVHNFCAFILENLPRMER